MRWMRVNADDAAALDPWCSAVGGAVLGEPEPARAAARSVDAIAIVVWNVGVGAGEIGPLLAELRRGSLTGGRAARHFVVLLQEAWRSGAAVPGETPSGSRSAWAIDAPGDAARSIDAVAAREDLHLLYAPSMRNGAGRQEDRGNAILSTLPLSEPVAIELPFERQRRVAVAASVAGQSRGGAAWRLHLVSAHFDNFSSGGAFRRSFGEGRENQARGLVHALADRPAVLVGGDLNTWFGESTEPAVDLLARHLPMPRRHPPGKTYAPPYGFPRRRVDYAFLRAPEGWTVDYRVLRDRWGSDHAPLVGWVHPAP